MNPSHEATEKSRLLSSAPQGERSHFFSSLDSFSGEGHAASINNSDDAAGGRLKSSSSPAAAAAAAGVPPSLSYSSLKPGMTSPRTPAGGVHGARPRGGSSHNDSFLGPRLQSYDFHKAEWVSMDVLQSMSCLAQQNLYVVDGGGSRTMRALLGFWRLLQRPILIFGIAVMATVMGYAVDWFNQNLFFIRWWLIGDMGSWWTHLAYLAVTASFVAAAALVTHTFCPIAAGGGVPEVKTLLNGVGAPALFSKRLVAVKMVGTILASASGLSVGKEGPLIQMSCAMAGVLMSCRIFRYTRVNTPKYLDLLHCACAAGVAATFGSAFGSTLFSVEITSTTFWVSSLPGCFLTAIMVVVTFWRFGMDTVFALYSGDSPGVAPAQASRDMVLWLTLGVLCGLLSTVFVSIVEIISKWRNRITRVSLGQTIQFRRRMMIIAAFSLIAIPCGFLELLYYREVSNISQNPHALVDHMFVPEKFGLSWHLCLYTTVKFVAIVFSVTQPLPVGLFSPVFLLGGAFGRLFGEVAHYLAAEYDLFDLNFQPWEFALIGAAAFSGGVTRTVSTAAIVYELSGESHLRIPLGAALLVSYYISACFTKGVYDSLIDTGGQPILPPLPPSAYTVEVRDIMVPAARMPMLSLDATHADAARLLHEHKDPYIIPIVRSHDSCLVGAVLRDDLELAVEDFELRLLLSSRQEQDEEAPFISGGEESRSAGEAPKRPRSPQAVPRGIALHGDVPLHFMVVKGGNKLAPVRVSGEPSSCPGGNGTANDPPHLRQSTSVMDELTKSFGDIIPILMDPSPFTVVEATDLRKLEYLFVMLKVDVAFVLKEGQLTGWVTRDRLRSFIGESEAKPLDDCLDVCRGAGDLFCGRGQILFLHDAIEQGSGSGDYSNPSIRNYRNLGITSMRVK
jgi:chloride channel 2